MSAFRKQLYHHHADEDEAHADDGRQIKRCLKNIHATAEINTMPMPDQMAYITPVGMWRMVSDKK